MLLLFIGFASVINDRIDLFIGITLQNDPHLIHYRVGVCLEIARVELVDLHGLKAVLFQVDRVDLVLGVLVFVAVGHARRGQGPGHVEKAGVVVGLAVDGSASNDGSSLIEEMRVAYLLHRLNSSNEAPSGYDILKIATRGSAKILGRDKLGQIACGMAADFFMIRQNRLALVGTQMDVGSMLATVGFRESVDITVVNGKVVVRDGKLLNVDEERIAREADQIWRSYLKK